MAKGAQKVIPVGLKKLSKGRHSEKNTQHKADWFQPMIQTPSGWVGGPKQTIPWVPPCVPGNHKY